MNRHQHQHNPHRGGFLRQPGVGKHVRRDQISGAGYARCRNRCGEAHEEAGPAGEESGRRAVDFPQINVLAAGPRHHCTQLGVAQGATERNQPADHPAEQHQPAALHLRQHQPGGGKNPGADHVRHHHAGGSAYTQPPTQLQQVPPAPALSAKLQGRPWARRAKGRIILCRVSASRKTLTAPCSCRPGANFEWECCGKSEKLVAGAGFEPCLPQAGCDLWVMRRNYTLSACVCLLQNLGSSLCRLSSYHCQTETEWNITQLPRFTRQGKSGLPVFNGNFRRHPWRQSIIAIRSDLPPVIGPPSMLVHTPLQPGGAERNPAVTAGSLPGLAAGSPTRCAGELCYTPAAIPQSTPSLPARCKRSLHSETRLETSR